MIRSPPERNSKRARLESSSESGVEDAIGGRTEPLPETPSRDNCAGERQHQSALFN